MKKFLQKYIKNPMNQKDKETVKELVNEGNDYLSKLQQIDQEILCIQKSTKTTFSFFSPIHNYCRTKYSWYYNWHAKPYATKVHAGVLSAVLLSSLAIGSLSLLGKPNFAKAADYTCTFTGAIDISWDNSENWSGCNDLNDYPGQTEGMSYDIVIPAGKTVDIYNNNMDFTGGGTSGGNITVAGTLRTTNNNFTANSITISTGGTITAGSSTITVKGNWDSSAGTFTKNTSSVVFSGSGTLKASAAAGGDAPVWPFYDVTINEGVTTTINFNFGASHILTVNGTLSDPGNQAVVFVINSTVNPLVLGANYNISSIVIRFDLRGAGITVPATVGQALNLRSFYIAPFGAATTATLNGNLTVTANSSNGYALRSGATGVLATNGYTVNATGLDVSLATLNASSSTFTSSKLAITNLIATSATINVSGAYTITNPTAAWNAGASTVNFNGAAQTITTGGTAAPLYNATFSGSGNKTISGNLNVNHDLSLSAGTLKLDTNNPNLIVNGSVAISNGAVWTKGTGTVTFAGTTAATYTDSNATNQNIGTVVINKTDTSDPGTNNKLTLLSGMKLDVLTVDGTTNSADIFDLGSGSYTLEFAQVGAVTAVGTISGTISPGNSTTKFTATNSGGNITVPVAKYNNLQISGAETYDLAGSLTGANAMTGNLTIDSGATLNTYILATSTSYDISCNDITINASGTLYSGANDVSGGSIFTLTGSFTRSGTFTYGISTLDFVGTGSITGSGNTFHDIKIAATISGSRKTTTLNNGITANGTLTLGGGTVAGTGGISLGGSVETPLLIATDTVIGPAVNFRSRGGSNIFNVPAGNYSTLSIGGSSGADVTFNATGPISATALNVEYGLGTVFNANGNDITTTTLHVGDGTVSRSHTLNMGANTLNVNGDLTIYASDETHANSLTFTSGNLNLAGNFVNNDVFTAGTSTANFTKTSGTQTLNSGGTAAANTFNNLTHSGAGTLQLATNALNVDGNFTNSNGVFDANNLDVNIAKDWNISGGSFNPKVGGGATTQKVTFDSTNAATISGSTTFNNLVTDASADGAKTINFTAGTTQTISAGKTWTLTGASGKVLTLRSTSAGAPWYFSISTPFTSGSYVSTQDSYSANANKITPGPNVTNVSNNDGWVFNQAPNAPTLLGPASYIDGAWQGDNAPTLTFTITDPDVGDQVKYQILISSQSDFVGSEIDYTSPLQAQGAKSYTVSPALPDGSYYWKVKTIDASNVSSSYSEVGDSNFEDIFIDTAVPTTDIYLDPAAPTGNNSYYKTTAPAVSFTADDNGYSGASTIYYRWGGSGDFSAYSAPLTAPEGTNTIYYYGTDLVGNSGVGSPFSREIKVDTVTPNVTATANPVGPNGSNNYYTGVAPAISLASSDVTSGLLNIQYKWDSGSYAAYSTPLTALEGVHTLYYYAVDNAGNSQIDTPITREFKFDSTSPTASSTINPASPNGANGWYKATAPTITLSAEDTVSDLAKLFYKWDNSQYSEYSTQITAPEGVHTLYYYGVDNAGNSGINSPLSCTVQLDTTAPILSEVTPIATTPTNKLEVPFMWSGVSDGDGSGIDHYLVTIGSTSGGSDLENGTVTSTASFTKTFTAAGTYYIRIKAVDKMGYVSDYSKEGSVLIDLIPPTISVEGITDNQYITSKTFSLKGKSSDISAGVNYVEITFDDKDTVRVTSSDGFATWAYDWSNYTEGLHTIDVKSIGKAGNISEKVRYAVIVDTTVPTQASDFRAFNVSNATAQVYAVYLDFADSTDDTAGVKSYELYKNGTKLADIPIAKGTTNQYYTGNQNQPYLYIDSGLSSGKYAYKVKAIDNAGNSSETAELSLDTAGKTIETDAISDAKGIASSVVTKEKTAATISWKTVYPATSYVEYGTSASYGSKTETDTNLNQGHSVLLSDLKPGTVYHAKVKSKDIYGKELESADFTFTTKNPPEDQSVVKIIVDTLQNLFRVLTAGAADSVTAGTATTEQLSELQAFGNNLLVTDVSFKEKNYYGNILTFEKNKKIEKSTDSKNYQSVNTGGNDYFFDKDLTAAATYYYREDEGVPVVRKPLVGDDSPLSITEEKVEKESVLTSKDKVQLTVSWQTNRGASSQVEFGASGSYGQKTKEDASLNMGHNVIIEDLNPDTTYHFKVTSKDAKGNIAASNDFTYQTPSAQKDKTTLDTVFESFQRVWNSIKGVF